LSNNNYHWSKNKRQVLSKCVFVELLTEIEVFDKSPAHRRVLSLGLHPSSFHCCLSQDPSHVSVLSLSGLLVLGARVRHLLWGIVCPRKLFERESSRSRGDINGLSRCLVLRLVSSLEGAKVLSATLSLS
jgi:hypothetical protein